MAPSVFGVPTGLDSDCQRSQLELEVGGARASASEDWGRLAGARGGAPQGRAAPPRTGAAVHPEASQPDTGRVPVCPGRH
eukprot:1354081-Rhodomonas_salina.3